MKHFSLLFCSLFILTISCFSQEKNEAGIKILFQGLVLDESTLKVIPGSQIMINRIFRSVSGNDGTFAVYVDRKDTIVFKSLGYKPTNVVISDTLKGHQYLAGIYMTTDTLLIGEVVIIPRFTNLKSEILNSRSKAPSTMDNARYNVAVSAYQGRNSVNKLGDPSSNYQLLRQKQKIDAFEKGGIPSDRIIGLNPLLLIPGAYLLMHGLPEKPTPYKPDITEYELDQINKKFLESLKQKK
jgi:hypothetical protein